MIPVPKSLNDFMAFIQNTLGNPVDLYYESFGERSFSVVFLSTFTDKTELQTYLLTPLSKICHDKTNPTWDKLLASVPKGIHFRREAMGEIISDLLN